MMEEKAAFTRWLSHDQAVATIRKTLKSLLTTLEWEVAENDDAVARGLLHAMKSYNFIATSSVMFCLTKSSFSKRRC